MAEAIRRDDFPPDSVTDVIPTQTVPITQGRSGGSGNVFRELKARSEELRDWVANRATANSASILHEIQYDAEYLRLRARYYHERRPLFALGAVAGAAFGFGLILGLWRH